LQILAVPVLIAPVLADTGNAYLQRQRPVAIAAPTNGKATIAHKIVALQLAQKRANCHDFCDTYPI
jgi:hypothetical protein